MKDFKIFNPFLKKRIVRLSDGTAMSAQEYIDKFVLPRVGEVKSIKLSSGQSVPLNTFINQYVLTDCFDKYNGDFDRFYSDNVMDNINQFFSKNHIDIESISKLSEAYIYNMEDLNPIVAKYGICNDPIQSQISVADIVGISSGASDYDKRNITNNLDLFFSRYDEKIISYSNRANGMLDYSKDNIISGLYNSLKKEPIVVVKLENGQALISENGLHRYHLLRIFYLDELSKTNSEDAKRNLDKKYTIPVKVETVDFLKTYCNYLLRLSGADFNLYVERNDKLEQTKNSILELRSKRYVLGDQQLLEVVRANLDKINVNSPMLYDCYNKIPSFRDYISSYFPELTIKQEESRGIRS